MTNHETIKKTYDDTSLKHVSEVTIYPGVVETLQRLKDDGNKIAVVTSKSADRTEVMIQGLPDFDFVVSPKQGLRGKPNPDQLLFCMAMCNVDPQDTYYIGDMQTDYDAAQRAGVEFIHVKYGYGKVKCKITLSRIEQLILP
jgi:phosphoglycolate phosphatase